MEDRISKKDNGSLSRLSALMCVGMGRGDLMELKPAEIRGVKSDGMICGANEIGLADAFRTRRRKFWIWVWSWDSM